MVDVAFFDRGDVLHVFPAAFAHGFADVYGVVDIFHVRVFGIGREYAQDAVDFRERIAAPVEVARIHRRTETVGADHLINIQLKGQVVALETVILESGAMTPAQLAAVRAVQHSYGGTLDLNILEQGFLTEYVMQRLLARRWDIAGAV